MKSTILAAAALLGCAVATATPAAETAAADDDVFAKRGKGVVTNEAFDAKVARIPDEHRLGVIRGESRLRDIVTAMLRNAQLAADAREAGFQDDPLVQARMRLAADEELASAWLDHYVDQAGDADYQALAREYYMVNKDKFTTQPTIDVTHILIGAEERTPQEALAIARDLYERLQADPAQFDTFVAEYSDDPSAVGNHGQFTSVKRGDMVEPFERVAFNLEAGEISEPVKTQFGYHLIRLDNDNPPSLQSFEDVREALEERMRKQHRDRVRNDYLTSLHSLPVELTEEDLEAMVIRHFGEDAVGPRE